LEIQIRKPRKTIGESELPSTLTGKAQKKGDFVTVEVVYLRDMPLLERHKEANKPLYLTRYE
jgi:hypothetical protein